MKKKEPHFKRPVCASVHKVAAGDTLYRIARKYGVDYGRLMALNGITNPYNLPVGTEICIPPIPGSPGSGCSAYYVIREGDTLYSIARKFGVALEDLMGANAELDPYNMHIGTKICIPPKTNTPMPPERPHPRENTEAVSTEIKNMQGETRQEKAELQEQSQKKAAELQIFSPQNDTVSSYTETDDDPDEHARETETEIESGSDSPAAAPGSGNQIKPPAWNASAPPTVNIPPAEISAIPEGAGMRRIVIRTEKDSRSGHNRQEKPVEAGHWHSVQDENYDRISQGSDRYHSAGRQENISSPSETSNLDSMMSRGYSGTAGHRGTDGWMAQPYVSDAMPDGILYRVEPGETLTDIQRKFGICFSALNYNNPSTDLSGDLTGLTLNIPYGDKFCIATDNQTYIIRSSDDLDSISERHNISTDDLLRMNPQKAPEDFSSLGSRIRISGDM